MRGTVTELSIVLTLQSLTPLNRVSLSLSLTQSLVLNLRSLNRSSSTFAHTSLNRPSLRLNLNHKPSLYMPKIKRLKETQTGKLTFGSGTAVVASLQRPLFARFQGFPPSTEVRFFFLVFRVFVVVSLIFFHFSSHLPFYILQLGFQFGLW